MYLLSGALSVDPMFSSRAIMTLLTRKYTNAAKAMFRTENEHSELSDDEILMLLRTPIYRLLLQLQDNKTKGIVAPNNSLFDQLDSLSIDRQILMKSSNHVLDLITPAPFLTSLLEPSKRGTNDDFDSSSLLFDIFENLPAFSKISSKWNIRKPTNLDLEMIKSAFLEFGKIATEPIEDIAFNVRFIAVLEPNTLESVVTRRISFSSQFLPGIIFMGGTILQDSVLLVETLYHESLHIKWINTLHVYSLIYFEKLPIVEKFFCPWKKGSEDKEWTFMRAVGAYHVYCHLLAFHRLIVYKGVINTVWSSQRIPIIREKLQIISEYINRFRYKSLTTLGIKYLELLSSIGEM